MNKLKRVSAFALAGMALVSASGPSHALGFGKPASRAILGDTLLVTVPVRLESGEEITDECLAADVYFGDEKVSGSAVNARVQTGDGGARVLKVSTTALINEPVVTIYLAAGCQARMTRKFVAFADPPGMALPTVVEPVAVTPSNVALTDERADEGKPARKAGAVAKTPRQQHLAAGSGQAKHAASREDKARAAGAEVLARVDETPTMSPKAARVAPEPTGGDLRPSQRAGLRAEQNLGAAKPADADVAERGRLVLDGGDMAMGDLPPLRMSASMATIIEADDQSPAVLAKRRAAAAVWQALNATPEAMARDRQRLTDLEQRLAQLTTENQQTKQALAEAQGLGGSTKWLVVLGLLAVAGLGAAAYFARQLKAKGSKGKDAWWQSQIDSQVGGGQREPVSDPASEMERTSAFVRKPDGAPAEPPKAAGAVRPAAAAKVAATLAPKSDGKSAASPMAPPPAVFTPPAAAPVTRQNLHEFVPDSTTVPAAFSTVPPAVLASRSAEPLREVSVEELIDLEQQAEFFVVLGQDDAAVSLLEGHVTQTTGASPLPFLKLLEIYRRLGRRDDYDRVQTQFNLRFNAHAPSWDSDQQQSHTLEDYPGVVERLQSLWNTPAKAMEVLEKSLTRPESSADTFELPAYRELLFLYAVARDLSEREPHERANVDLLLPSLEGEADVAVVKSDGGAAVVEDSGEPLMATRPIKAQPEALPSMSLDFHLDDLPEPSDAAKHH